MNPEENPVVPVQVEQHPAWQRVLLARHPKRPHSLDYIGRLCTDFEEMHGDRAFGDDPAIVTGMAQFEGRAVMFVGEQKGRDTKQKIYRNFGMPKPEGYRKALRAMQLAGKFGRPIVTFLDTPGAYPGIDAEERGQAEAIARNLREMARLPVPVIVVCIGEGGSGGALALGVGNVVLMLENAVYSVISPESCANILYRDSGKAEQAAASLKLTAEDLQSLELIDGIVPEPPGGAQENPELAAETLRGYLARHINEMAALSPAELIEHRYAKFRKMGELLRVKKTVWIAIAFVVLVVGWVVVSSLAPKPFRCRVCMAFEGRRDCRTASADTRNEALRTAVTNACAQLSGGVTGTMQCESTKPESVDWLRTN